MSRDPERISEKPIRAELFGIERLEQHAESLAAAERTTARPRRGRDLLPRVRENARVLLAGYRDIVEAVAAKSEITLAEEWFLDNFHVVDEQLREIRDHLPSGYYRSLPKIAAGHLAGCPACYGLAWAYVAHTDSRFELETLPRFVRAYQRVQPLTIGELWAVPSICAWRSWRTCGGCRQLIRARHERARADALADRLLGLGDEPRGGPRGVCASSATARWPARSPCSSSSGCVTRILRSRRPSPGSTGSSARRARRRTRWSPQEHQAQGAANVTVRNIITSMRWMSSIDWPEFFESVSLVDEVLRTAPAFAAMDFATRDEYRKQIELLSRGSGHSEIDVAREAVRLARRRPPIEELVRRRRARDPGYYLVAEGRGPSSGSSAFASAAPLAPRAAARTR